MELNDYQSAGRILDALDELYDRRDGAELRVLAALVEQREMVNEENLQRAISEAIERTRATLKRDLDLVQRNEAILLDTDDVRLACAAVKPAP